MRRTAAILTAAALALAGAGCGSSSGPTKASFAKEFRVERNKLRLLGDDVGAAVATAKRKTDAMLAAEFRLLAERATGLAGALGGLNAPKPYRNELSALQSSVTQVAGTLQSIRAAAIAHDATAARAGGEAIVADAAQVKSYTNSLSTKIGLPSFE